ncbi:hypothetical protein HYX18_00190 [Candidatus Woesearchaeota archaeon]|nr:hypothetical protein [Candidatus Woesearchaeota archaeon]
MMYSRNNSFYLIRSAVNFSRRKNNYPLNPTSLTSCEAQNVANPNIGRNRNLLKTNGLEIKVQEH